MFHVPCRDIRARNTAICPEGDSAAQLRIRGVHARHHAHRTSACVSTVSLAHSLLCLSRSLARSLFLLHALSFSLSFPPAAHLPCCPGENRRGGKREKAREREKEQGKESRSKSERERGREGETEREKERDGHPLPADCTRSRHGASGSEWH